MTLSQSLSDEGGVAGKGGGGARVIYHGTPMTPRAALLDVCADRAMCVSFFRPDDVEAVEAISPAIMFRQRGVFVLAASSTSWERMGGTSRLDALLRVARGSVVSARSLGGYTRQPRCAFPAQRCAAQRVAVRTAWSAALAHGWAYRAAVAPVRAIRPRVLGLDRRGGGRDRGLSCLSGAHGGSVSRSRQPLAGSAHDARRGRGLRLPIRQRGFDFARPERMAL